MVNVTFSLPRETVERLRRVAKSRGRRGSISELVNASLTERLSAMEAGSSEYRFIALRGSEEVARATSLRELAAKLESLGTDPRSVEIRSDSPSWPVARMGLRGTQA